MGIMQNNISDAVVILKISNGSLRPGTGTFIRTDPKKR